MTPYLHTTHTSTKSPSTPHSTYAPLPRPLSTTPSSSSHRSHSSEAPTTPPQNPNSLIRIPSRQHLAQAHLDAYPPPPPSASSSSPSSSRRSGGGGGGGQQQATRHVPKPAPERVWMDTKWIREHPNPKSAGEVRKYYAGVGGGWTGGVWPGGGGMGMGRGVGRGVYPVYPEAVGRGGIYPGVGFVGGYGVGRTAYTMPWYHG
ncbi:hypothetical protein L202_08425 [Cryptococcus amylolentus CBS 6039]|uniref:Uncharacterized protein n=2 Tax=Cryptococcus amylolentus TaxID=104669 RepID=A0A1E3H9N3_9TREE|nr:hypothetical protein L202_08425 [Cryptococcus amylolentus CBS 6039]ODN73030.1 hypothetical protein L202_08425 [Cryptococcus amylolentus CBS 6039]ODN98182.1 hypothetical protein I350_07828 [Cryptococcus amylolentus CBS 6273]